MVRPVTSPPLRAYSLRDGEHATLARALAKAGLPIDDLDERGRMFFRFEASDEIPVGFGGLEIHGEDALLRSVVTLPPIRKKGIGTGIVAALEGKAASQNCRRIYLLTTTAADFFQRLGYSPCRRADVPNAIQNSLEFSQLCPASAVAMLKRIT